MTFSKMKVDELRKVATDFGVDLEPAAKKEEILAELEENGVSWNEYNKMLAIKEAQDSAEDDDPTQKPQKPNLDALDSDATSKYFSSNLLLKMIGKNSSLQVLGFTFSQSHPFQFMSAKDAQEIINFYPERFRVATPQEAEDFYK